MTRCALLALTILALAGCESSGATCEPIGPVGAGDYVDCGRATEGPNPLGVCEPPEGTCRWSAGGAYRCTDSEGVDHDPQLAGCVDGVPTCQPVAGPTGLVEWIPVCRQPPSP